MSVQYGPFELPVLQQAKGGTIWNNGGGGHGAMFLLPNGYILSIEQRTGGEWDARSNTAEIAVLVPSKNGQMVIDEKAVRGFFSEGGEDDTEGSVTPTDAVRFLRSLIKIPRHRNYTSLLAEVNKQYPLIPLDPATLSCALTPLPVAQLGRLELSEIEKIHSLADKASTPETVATAFQTIARIETAGYRSADEGPRDTALLALAQKGADREVLKLFLHEARVAFEIEVAVDHKLGRIATLAETCPSLLPDIIEDVDDFRHDFLSDAVRPKVLSLLDRISKGYGYGPA